MIPPTDQDPSSIGPYSVLRRLGSGGSGDRYLARSPTGRLVAVKVLHPALADDPEFRRRFAREVAAARRVNGLPTVEVIDADPQAPLPWFATRYVQAPDLASIVAQRGALPADEVLRLAAGIAEALGLIHAQGLIHRQLAPSAVILAAEGPQLVDLGIAGPPADAGAAVPGTVLDTLGCLPPEAASAGESGPPGDIFSLGCVLYFAATGSMPFGSGPPFEIVLRILDAEPDLGRVGDPRLRRLIADCLRKDPRRRPTAQQVAERAIAGLAGGTEAEHATARPAAVHRRLQPRTARWLTRIGLQFLAVVAVVGMPAVLRGDWLTILAGAAAAPGFVLLTAALTAGFSRLSPAAGFPYLARRSAERERGIDIQITRIQAVYERALRSELRSMQPDPASGAEA